MSYAEEQLKHLEELSKKEPGDSILTEAHRLVHGQRGQDYGHPYEDFSRTAKIWSAILGIEVTPQQAILCMIAVKISRECHRPKRDNRVDIAGYAEALDMVVEFQACSMDTPE
jgi:hypothetical protein